MKASLALHGIAGHGDLPDGETRAVSDVLLEHASQPGLPVFMKH